MAKIGLDFYSVFSPMAMLETARTLLAKAVNYKCPVAHADVPMAFIQQDMDTATWIYPPDGVEFDLLKSPEREVSTVQVCFETHESSVRSKTKPRVME
mmetsp:Transcript_10794/g.32533  ORF Transcript_10794/g.32533 Transcript_10794/m.32533 type:complete len:98 (+) Transcript_10794:62-355(+)